MLGLADSNDPTPPIDLGPRLWFLLMPLLAVADLTYGLIRVWSSPWDGLVFILSGVAFLALGVQRIVAWRRARRVSSSGRAPESDGGTADRP